MKTKFFLAWIVLVLAAAACLCNGSNGGDDTSPDLPQDTSIGSITRVTDNVLQNQIKIEDNQSKPLQQRDSVGLIDGGECVLDFRGDLVLRLFNDTQVEDIQSEVDSGSSMLARMRLEYGGFTGSLTAVGKSVPFETPNGAIITVYGTDFFLVYDPASSTTTVGNFQGSLEVQIGSGPPQPVPGQTMRQVLPGGEISPELPLIFSRGDFEQTARQTGSSVAALQALAITILEPEPIPVDNTPPTFEVLGIDPPTIIYGSECPGSVGETRLTMRIIDESQIANATVEWELNGVVETRLMERIDDQTFTVLIGPLQDYGVLNIVVRAEDVFGNPGQYEPIQIKVEGCIG